MMVLGDFHTVRCTDNFGIIDWVDEYLDLSCGTVTFTALYVADKFPRDGMLHSIVYFVVIFSGRLRWRCCRRMVEIVCWSKFLGVLVYLYCC